MTWAGIKKGDTVLEVYAGGKRVTASHAKSVGRRWITTTRGAKYDAETGHGEYGYRVHTEASLAEEGLRTELCSRIRRAVDLYGGRLKYMPLETLERVADLLDEADR